MQMAQTYLNGYVVSTVTIRSEADYTAHLRAMVGRYGSGTTTVCCDVRTPAKTQVNHGDYVNFDGQVYQVRGYGNKPQLYLVA